MPTSLLRPRRNRRTPGRSNFKPDPAGKTGNARSPMLTPAMDRIRTRSVLAGCVCLAVGILAIYIPAAHNPFLSVDDPVYVTDNAHVQAGLTRDTLEWALTATAAQNWHPLTWLSHALDCQIYGLN